MRVVGHVVLLLLAVVGEAIVRSRYTSNSNGSRSTRASSRARVGNDDFLKKVLQTARRRGAWPVMMQRHRVCAGRSSRRAAPRRVSLMMVEIEMAVKIENPTGLPCILLAAAEWPKLFSNLPCGSNSASLQTPVGWSEGATHSVEEPRQTAPSSPFKGR